MAIREKIERFKQEAVSIQRGAIEDERARKRAHQEQVNSELPQAIEIVDAKLRRLRRLGVVAAIEDLVEERIKPLEDHRSRLTSPSRIKGLAHPTIEDIQRVTRHKDYSARVLQPYLSEGGDWDNDLKIKVWVDTSRHVSFILQGNSTPWVEVRYDGDTVLSVLSRNPELRVPLFFRRVKRIEAFEELLARGVLNPLRPDSQRATPRFNEIIGGHAS